MKKIIFTVICCATTILSIAQSTSYTPVQVNGTLGFAATSGTGTKGGGVIVIEPQYHYTDNLSFGIKASFALTLKASLDASGNVSGNFSGAGIASYQATGSYYFQTAPGAKFRPWTGVGVGFGRSIGVSGNTTNTLYADDYSDRRGLTASVRAGFDVNHFRLAIDYNINPKTGRINNNFFGINLGFYLGGGSKPMEKIID